MLHQKVFQRLRRRVATEVDHHRHVCRRTSSDRAGYRVGYGAGYYDMTITRLRAMKPIVAIGFAFAAQEIPAVAKTAHDARLDLVLTEKEIIDLRK